MRGTLIYVDATGCPEVDLLDDGNRLQNLVENACELGGATVLHTAVNRFEPQGVTVAAILAESHATLHTYPEVGGYMLDVCTCGQTADASGIVAVITGILGGHIRLTAVERGACAETTEAAADGEADTAAAG